MPLILKHGHAVGNHARTTRGAGDQDLRRRRIEVAAVDSQAELLPRYRRVHARAQAADRDTLGNHKRFSTKQLTIEFKNNLDGLIADVDGDSPKTFGHIDVCMCWSKIAGSFKGYEVEQITESNLDERQFRGVTHLLRRDGDLHVVKLVMLQTITSMIEAGNLVIPVV
jgi:hypothetical protein